jgi:hypothetical protein
MLVSALIGNGSECTRGVDEFFLDPAGKLDCLDEVAYTETEAHRDDNTVPFVIVKHGRLEIGGTVMPNR